MNNDPFNLKRKCVVGNIINLAVFDYKHKFQTVLSLERSEKNLCQINPLTK